MQPQQGGGLYSPESASRRKSASSEKVLVQSVPNLLQLALEESLRYVTQQTSLCCSAKLSQDALCVQLYLSTLHDFSSLRLVLLRHMVFAVIPMLLFCHQARATSTSASASSSSASSRASTVSSRARSQPDPASLLGLFRSGVDLNARSSPSTSANSTTASATGGSHRRWTTDAEGSSPSAKARSKGQGSLGKMRHTADHASPK